MATRNLSLTPRNEDTREKQSIEPVIQFELIQIKEHFEDSMQSIEQQFAIAEKMKEEGCLSDCKNTFHRHFQNNSIPIIVQESKL